MAFSVCMSEKSLSHPPGFSNYMGFEENGNATSMKHSFVVQIQKTLDICRAMGFNMDDCFDRVKEVVQGHEVTQVVT